MFYVGQKVVCIDDSDIYTSVYNEITPKKGIEYTVRDVCDNESIRLVEIINEPQLYIGGFMECLFRPFRFAPLETYGETYSIAIQLIQELEQVDKQKIFNPEKIKA